MGLWDVVILGDLHVAVLEAAAPGVFPGSQEAVERCWHKILREGVETVDERC
jgi:hypothetical protein